MSKKNIDKLFQEKFNGFQESPDPKVWQSIEASLNEKDKKRRIIPLWWKLGGIAATLALGFFLFNTFNNSNTIPDTIITETPNSNKEESKTSNPKNTKGTLENKDQESQIADTKKSASEKENTILLNPSKKTINSSKNNTINVASSANNSKKKGEYSLSSINRNTEKTEDISSNIDAKSTDIAETSKKQKSLNPGINTATKKGIDAKNKLTNAIALNESEKTKAEEESSKKSIYDEIEAQKTEKEDALAKTNSNKWSAGATVAPVYFNAIGDGSPVSSMFVTNSKSGDTNLSYGLSVAYAVSNKLSVRSGIHKVDYAYNTNDVSFSSSFTSKTSNQLSTINYDNSSSNLEVISTVSNIEAFSSPKTDTASDVTSKTPEIAGVMSQQFDYLEVPLELKYQLVDSKFGVDIIGGVSSLFLLDNAVLLSSGSKTTTLGEANNMNSVNFSTNVGIGLNYKFTPKIKINVEPMFKYQLNTFSSTEGTFEPYSIGIYSGLTFKF